MRWILIGCFLAAGLISVAHADAQTAQEWDAQAVEEAVKKAKAYLWSQWADGHWKPYVKGDDEKLYKGGATALCAYALLSAGENPYSPRMQETLEWLAKIDTEMTYVRAMRASVWGVLEERESLKPKGKGKKRYRRLLKKDVDWLVSAVDSRGTYNYTKGDRGIRKIRNYTHEIYDNSNSQLAVLGVWAGKRNGTEVPRKYWEWVEKHWTSDQNPDGGWPYRKGGEHQSRSYSCMTAAGLASMFICFDMLHQKKFIRCSAKSEDKHITAGLKWMDKNFDPNKGSYRYYHYYAIERVGLASGYKYFGEKDWYKIIASMLLKRQAADGHWTGSFNDHIDTSFALLFLARGQHPVLFNKLKYPGMWNCRPRDLANFTKWVSRSFEKEVNWQIIQLNIPVEEWHDAPILYISGATAPKFSDEDIESLRKFVLQGGVIFSEAACSKGAFNSAMKKYYARIFPKRELTRLPNDHPIYSIHYKVKKRGLMGISNGVRLLAIHSPSEVSLAWQLNAYATSADTFRLGANIYFYVTDKGSLRNRGVSPWPMAKKFTPAKTLKVAQVKYAGNYSPEPLAWERFSIMMGNRHKIAVKVAEPTPIAALDAASQPIAAMTGTGAFSLTAEECEALRKYINAGGTLVIDAAGGSKAFTESAEKAFAKILPDGKYGPIASSHALYTQADFAIEKVSYRKAIGGSARKPRLWGVSHKGRLAIVFSPDDLTAGLLGYPCWGLRGYEPESAFELMRNILLHVPGKTLKE